MRRNVRRALRAGAGAGVQGLRRAGTAPTSSWRPAGRPCTRCWRWRAAAPARTSSTTTSPSSTRRRWSRTGREQTYRYGLHAIAAQPVAARPLPRPLRRRGRRSSSSASTTTSTSRARSRRRDDTIVFYSRAVTPRRAVAARRCSRWPSSSAGARDLRIVHFGDREALHTPFEYEHAGIASPAELSWLYSEADRRALPVADQLLADPAGDAGLRPAVRGSGRASARRPCSAPDGPVDARAVRRRRARRRARAAARRRRAAARRSAPGDRVRRLRTPGTTRPSRSSAGCARRCACARAADAPDRVDPVDRAAAQRPPLRGRDLAHREGAGIDGRQSATGPSSRFTPPLPAARCRLRARA